MKYKYIVYKYVSKHRLQKQLMEFHVYKVFAETMFRLVTNFELIEYDDKQCIEIMNHVNEQVKYRLLRLHHIYATFINADFDLINVPICLHGQHTYDNNDTLSMKITTESNILQARLKEMLPILTKLGLTAFGSNRGKFNRKQVKKVKMLYKEGAKITNMTYLELTEHKYFIEALETLK